MKIAGVLFGSLFFLAAPAFGETPITPAEINAELTQVASEISNVDALIKRYDGGLIRSLAEARRETLLLGQGLLENRLLAAEGGVALELKLPAVRPDPEKADEIRLEMKEMEARIAATEKEAANAGGLIQAVILSRLETEKLTLAQLGLALQQARFGLAIPAVTSAPIRNSTQNNEQRSENPEPATTVVWADSRYPEIDYDQTVFSQAASKGEEISGWWTIEREKAALDDSPKVTAVNYSAYDPNSFAGITGLISRCSEGESAFIFVQDEYLISDFRRNTFSITYRIDQQPAKETRWSSLTNNKGAGLFGREAEQFMRQAYDAEKLFIRLVEKNGKQHDAEFDLSGTDRAFDAVASACGWSTLTLSSDDLRAIQTLLNAGGFDAGTPDGQWGPGSKRAMRKFQASVGLPETGAADRATLNALGLE